MKKKIMRWLSRFAMGIALFTFIVICNFILFFSYENRGDISGNYGTLIVVGNIVFLAVLFTKQYFTLSAERASAVPQEMMSKLLSGNEADTDVLFEGVETQMETLSEEIMNLEAALAYIKENMEKQVEELMLSTLYHRLLAVQRLISGSAYAALTEPEAKDQEGYLKKTKDAFLTDIAEVLAEGSRIRNRAVMAGVLRELPVFFNNHTEVMNYVRNSLEGCRDEKEKKISVELLRSYY